MILYFLIHVPGQEAYGKATIFIGKPKTPADSYPIRIYAGVDPPHNLRYESGTSFIAREMCHCEDGPAMISYNDKGEVMLEQYIIDGKHIGTNLGLYSKEAIQDFLLLT